MKNKMSKRINELKVGDKIGNFGFVYLTRNDEREREARAAGHNYTFVNAACPICGKVKAYNLNNLNQGNTKSCGCARGHKKDTKAAIEANSIDVNGVIAAADRKIDDRTEIKLENPHKRHTITAETADGRTVNEKAHGFDELWIKSLIMSDPQEATAARCAVYMANGELFGQAMDQMGDGNAKWADHRTVVECDGIAVDVYEEYDSNCHRIKHPTPRDNNVALGCAANNKGLFRIFTNVKAFKERDAETVMAIRKFAVNRIRSNVAHNAKVGRNELSTIIRVTNSYEIEEAIVCDGQIGWTQIAKISDFKAAHA